MKKLGNLKRKLSLLCFSAVMLLMCSVPVLASGETDSSLSTVETALESSFKSVGSSMTSVVGKILPIALPIMGAVVLIGFGIKIFKKISGKA